MSLGPGAFGADPLGALADQIADLAALGSPTAKRKALFIARRWAKGVIKAGEAVVLQSREGVKFSTRIAVRTLNPNVPLAGDLTLSDYSLIIPAKPLTDAGFVMEKGVIVWRFFGGAQERGIRIHLEPQRLGVEDVMLLYRAIGRG